jgi:hypothetical protein
MKELDPTGKYQDENLILGADEFKKQRELAYKHMRNTMKRESAGPYWSNALLGGLAGGVGGAFAGGARTDGDPLGVAIGSGIGALGGATAGTLARLASKIKQDVVTDDDIAEMKKRQKDRGRLSELMPFRDVYDAV